MKKLFKVCACASAIAAAFCGIQFLSGCSAEIGYEYCGEDGGYFIASLSGSARALDGEMIIPETYSDGEHTAPVKKIAQEGFRGAAIKKVQIPASVVEIGNAAFANCPSLQDVEFAEGSGLSAIPRGAFGFCDMLSNINLPDSVEEIGVLAFYSCPNLLKIDLPANLKVISDEAFESCENLAEVSFNEGLTTIGEMAFYTTGLTSLVIPDSVTKLGAAAFHTCRNLESAVVGKGLTSITSGTFGYCVSLKEVTIPASIKKIEGEYVTEKGEFICGHAFFRCDSLEKVNFGGSRADWDKIEIVKRSYENNSITYDNDAILKDTLQIIYAG